MMRETNNTTNKRYSTKLKDREYLIGGDGIKTGDITKWHNPNGELTHYTWRRYNKDGKKYHTKTFHTQGNGSGI